MSTWKVILATLVIYCAGLITGALVIKTSRPVASREMSAPPAWVFQGPDFVQQRFLERMKKELSLTPEQDRRLEVVLRESRERIKNWWEIISPEMQAELREVREKIRAELDSAQREKFEQLLKDRRHPAGEKHPRDRRPPGLRTNPPPGEIPRPAASQSNPGPPAPSAR